MQLKSAKNQVGHLEDYNIEKQSEINISHIRVEHMYLQLSTSTSLFNVKLIQNWEDFQDPAPKHVQGRRHAPGADVPCRRPSVPGRHALCCQFSATESPKKNTNIFKKNKKNTNLKFGNIPNPNLCLFLKFPIETPFLFLIQVAAARRRQQSNMRDMHATSCLSSRERFKTNWNIKGMEKNGWKHGWFQKKVLKKNCDTEKLSFALHRLFFVTSLDRTRECPEILRSSLYGCLPQENPIQETWQRKRQFIYDSTRWWMDLYSFLQSADITGPASAFFTSFSISYSFPYSVTLYLFCLPKPLVICVHAPRLKMQTNKVQWTKKTTVCPLRFRCWGPTHFQISHVFQCPLCTRELHLQHSQPSVAKCKSWVFKVQPVTLHIL